MKQFRLFLILCLCMAMNAKANETTANLLQQGDSCLSRYDVFHATQYYQKYLEANPSHLEARRKLASCYRKVGNYTACISCLDKIPSDSINHEDMRIFYYEPTLKSKVCLKCLYFTKIISDLCRNLEYFSYLYTIN